MNSINNIKDVLLGRPLKNDELVHEKMSTFWGLPIMASDAVSSVAYAVQEILMVLVPAVGIVAANFVGTVSLPIILLLLILVFSYSQIINHYPNGGGAYAVSLENFGQKAALLAATCLIIDYVMTVAVSISSSTAAIVAAFPVLYKYKVVISIICISFITLINLRGISESSKIFGVPTYVFIGLMVILIVTGFIRLIFGHLSPIVYSTEVINQMIPSGVTGGITILLLLRAFASGCSALTGVEAVSNAIPSFKNPPQKIAKHILYMLGGIIIIIFGGTSVLAGILKVIPLEQTTVISQMAQVILGKGFLFYALQIATSVILLLAANTAYNGLPFLLSILAESNYVPKQFSQRGTKLSFSNGIMFIFIIASILLIVFNADTHYLIPFYSVGVFLSFTLSQSGMFIKWLKLREPGWQYKSLINGFGAIVTLVGTVIVFLAKFKEGAWVLAILIPLTMYIMLRTYDHYAFVSKQVSLEGYEYKYTPSTSTNTQPCVLLVNSINKSTLKTLSYAKSVSSNIIPLHVSTNHDNVSILLKKWEELGIDIPMTVIQAPYRDIIPSLEVFVVELTKNLKKGECVTVVMTKFVEIKWYDMILHNQTTYLINYSLDKYKDIVAVVVPYIYNLKKDKNKRIQNV